MENRRVYRNTNEMYCPSCGEVVSKRAVICVNCDASPKSKNIAVLLSITFPILTW